MKCTNCGFELLPNSRFCSRCGTLVEVMPSNISKKCLVCGAEIKEGYMFCRKCGTSVSSVSLNYESEEKKHISMSSDRKKDSVPTFANSNNEMNTNANMLNTSTRQNYQRQINVSNVSDEKKGAKWIVPVIVAGIIIILIVAMLGLKGEKSSLNDEIDNFYTENKKNDVWVEEQDYYDEGEEVMDERGTLLAKIQNNYSADAVEYVGHVYAIYNIKEENLETWDECESFCEDMGGHLAVIETKEENDFLYQYIREKGLVLAFFGYTDQYSEGNWEWITGENAGYTNWAKGQPNNGKNNKNKKEENYAEFYKETQDGTWNDAPFGSNTHRFICEWED